MKYTNTQFCKMKYTFIFLLFLCLNIDAQNNHGNDSHPEDSQGKVCHQSYTVIESTKYDIPDGTIDEMSPGQLYHVRDLVKSFEEHFDFDSYGNMTYTILHGESTNYYEDWMTKPEMTVYTRHERLIRREKPNSSGEIQTIRENSEKDIALFDEIAMATITKNNNLIELPQIEEIESEGIMMNEDGIYLIELEGQAGIIHYKPNTYLFTSITVQTSDCEKQIFRIFRPVTGLSDRFALSYEKVTQPELVFDEFGITRTDESTYYNWQIEQCEDDNFDLRAKNHLSELNLYPNPVNNQLIVDLPKEWSGARFEIIDYNGSINECKLLKTSSNQMVIETQNLTNGMYYLRLISHDKVKSLKFIKSK